MGCFGEEMIVNAGRCVIVWFNTMFVVVGVVMVAIGVILKTSSDIGFVSAAENAIKIALNAVIKGTYLTNYSIDDFSISELFSGISTGMIIVGFLILVLSVFGCCGGCYRMKTMLIMYACLLGVSLLVQTILCILMYGAPNTIQSSIKDLLKQTLEDFQGIEGTNIASMAWMFVMYEFECCGVESYQDFHRYAPVWNRDPFNNGINITAPITCCVYIPATKDTSCALETSLDINMQGCFDAIWDKVLGKPLYAGIIFSVIFLFQAVLVVFSVIMSRNVAESQKVEPIYG